MMTNLKWLKKVNGKDRLSDLNDDILIHILSFLHDPKSAAQTCVLSKRWNNKLWMHLPDVYLHSKTFGENSYEFEKFVDMVLTKRDNFNHTLRSFSFCWTFESKIPQQLLDRIHSHAQSHDVRHFYLSIGCESGHRIYPSQNFKPKCLTTLRLNLSNWYGRNISTDSNLNLQDIYLAGCTALKTLWLETFIIDIQSTDDVDVFSSLKNLIELHIVGCYIVGNDRRFHVRSPKLERLTLLENVDYMGREIMTSTPHWVISTPLLKYLRIDMGTSLFSPCLLSSVEELEINFHTDILRGTIQAIRLINVIKGIPHVKSVTLSKSTLQEDRQFVVGYTLLHCTLCNIQVAGLVKKLDVLSIVNIYSQYSIEWEFHFNAVESSKPVSAGLKEAEELERYITSREEMYNKANEFQSTIVGLETDLKRPYFHDCQLGVEFENSCSYLDFIEAGHNFNKVLHMEANGSIDVVVYALACATQVFFKVDSVERGELNLLAKCNLPARPLLLTDAGLELLLLVLLSYVSRGRTVGHQTYLSVGLSIS